MGVYASCTVTVKIAASTFLVLWNPAFCISKIDHLWCLQKFLDMSHGAGSRICPNVAGPLGITAKPSWASKRLGDEPSPGQWVRAPINCGLALWAGMAYGHGERSQLQKKMLLLFQKNKTEMLLHSRDFAFFLSHTHLGPHTFFLRQACARSEATTRPLVLYRPRGCGCAPLNTQKDRRVQTTHLDA